VCNLSLTLLSLADRDKHTLSSVYLSLWSKSRLKKESCIFASLGTGEGNLSLSLVSLATGRAVGLAPANWSGLISF
jgi:hypothetical protein